jgi:hypothetical protein
VSIHTAAGQGCRVATSRSALAARREEAKGAVTAVETEAAARVVGEEVMEVRVAVRAVGVTVAVGMEVGELVEATVTVARAVARAGRRRWWWVGRW